MNAKLSNLALHTRLFVSLTFGIGLICLGGPAMALEWQNAPGHRSAPVTAVGLGSTGFSSISSPTSGVAFTNFLPAARHMTNQILLNGSGVAAGDIDGDGWCDLYFCALDRPNALYRNLGNWRFVDITETAGVACRGLTSSGAALADIDGDGDLDLCVNTVGNGTRVFTNDGRGRFSESAVLNRGKGGSSMALGDLDGDGSLDLYVANYRTQALMDMPNTLFNFANVNGQRVISRVAGRPVTDPEFTNRFRLNARGGIEENGQDDEVYRNPGGRGFVQIPFTGGAFLDEDGRPLSAPPFEWGLSVAMRDINQDGLPDLWICNDFDAPDRVWLNRGGGVFRMAPRLAIRKNSHFSMGVDVADINRDGWDDICVLDMLSRDHAVRMDMAGDRNPPAAALGRFDDRPEYMRNTLFVARGDGTWMEAANLAGVSATDWAWAVVFLDADLDGYEDIFVTNGNERQSRSLDVAERLRKFRTERQRSNAEILQARTMFPRYASANLAFRNRGDLTFEETGKAWGFDLFGVSHGMALADLDNDGDLDVVVNNLNEAASVYRNNTSAARLGVRLKGVAPNTRGIGARIRVRGGAVPEQSQEMIAGGRYLSSDDPMRVFAAGSATNAMIVEVTWRSGKTSTLLGARANHIYEIDEAAAVAAASSTRPVPPVPHFEDWSTRLQHSHVEEPFDDFARQPLLPNRLSQLGPGVAWGDWDGDGWEDLAIAAGKGGSLAVFKNDGRSGFQRMTGPALTQSNGRDQTTVLSLPKSGGTRSWLVGCASYEDGFTNVAFAREVDLGPTAPATEELFPGHTSSVGPMALADLDGDGILELFVGGRVVPGRWPEPASSVIFRRTGNRWQLDVENSSRFVGIGLVSGAVFSDLDGDSDSDLVLACEWGSLRFFRNDGGRLLAWDWKVSMPSLVPSIQPGAAISKMSQLTGWWNGVAAGDFDGDGRLDLIAANWGRNTPYEAHRQQPLRLYFGDFAGTGGIEPIESWFEPSMKRHVPIRQLDFLGRSMPFLRARFPSNESFARAALDEVLGDRLPVARQLEASWLESAVFLNRGDQFEVRALPVEVQLAPAFGIGVADFDGDGHEDVFLSQNFFASQPDTPRHDAGRGVWIRGDGTGGFKAVPGHLSGLKIYGEQRGTAVADFDHDGRTDLVVCQNAAETKLYRNASAKPGVRVRLLGGAGNPEGIGAVIRWKTGDRLGPARELHAGSGYWSQDAPTQVISLPAGASLQVRWPGGVATVSEVPAGTRAVTIDVDGKIVAHPN